ncbi:transport permease protein [Microtetraspora sp. NBRC 13810]|uniref:ABC transporter permease n=1 Tax=Microtetraspora sp. NBRC 13810 TaxID=3030990 RepID=UPI0024A18C6A|nr:ABC transporter permease [Microtetraspora sp. NBRC 13810]GLW11901.1 transport permease protein [Microtetraspora sp. NBRC 13810]
MTTIRHGLGDGAMIVHRNLLQLRHSPGAIAGAVMFPLAFVVLFGYVFGSAIPVGQGANYREYLMPGLFVMGIVMGVTASMIEVAGDTGLGVMDRLRSMPIARSAVPFGQTGSDLIVATATLVLMAATGLLVGWRAHNGIAATAAAFGLLLLLQYAMSWIAIYLGTLVKNKETAAKLGPLTMPLTMISNVFVPIDGMPAVLRFLAEWNPVSAAVTACRELFGNPGVPTGDATWPLAHPVLATLAWCAFILAVFVPLSIRRFARPY